MSEDRQQRPAPSVEALKNGDRIDAYQIEERIGAGSFGVVYRVYDASLDRRVALKFLKAHADDAQLRLFLREGKVAAGLTGHPGIVQIHHAGEYSGVPYLALEYVGSSLSLLLHNAPGGLPPKDAIELGAQAAEALAHAHAAGIIHRDIKPENLLYDTETDRVKIADLGLARFYDDRHASSHGTAGAGTPAYMPPEQLLGDADLDAMVDIYALGVTLYRLLCGGLPYEGKTPSETVAKILKRKGIPLRKRKEALPEVVYQIVEKATAYDRKKRFDSAKEMALALRDAAKLFGPDASTATISRTKVTWTIPRAWMFAAGACVIVSALVLWVQGSRGTSTAPEKEYQAANSASSTAQPSATSPTQAISSAAKYLDKGDNQRALDAVNDLTRDQFASEPQWDECLKLRGQAYYRLQDYARAAAVFDELAAHATGAAQNIAEQYVRLAREQLDAQHQQTVREQATKLRELIEKGDVQPAVSDSWTSRPLSFMLLPADSGNAHVFRESGLADVLPQMLGPAIEQHAHMPRVDREHLSVTLLEQELSAELASPEKRLALARVTGARLIVECRAARLQDKEFVYPVVVDAETTERISPDRVDVLTPLDPDAVVNAIADQIARAVHEAYPLKARLRSEDGATLLDIGTNVGVTTGMRFAIRTQPDAPNLPAKSVVVDGNVSEHSSHVRCEGFAGSDIAADGWYAVEQRD